MTTEPHAIDLVAKATGLRPDQVTAAIEEYRAAAQVLETEPEWRSLMHMSGPVWAGAQYVADGTAVILQIESWKEKGSDDWLEERRYQLQEQLYELFAEARAVEF